MEGRTFVGKLCPDLTKGIGLYFELPLVAFEVLAAF
jgi:hypothetical protein